MKTVALLALTVSWCAAASDVSGKWNGSAQFKSSDGESHDGGAYAVFKQNGQDVTGTAGPSAEEQHPIENGRLEGNKLTFQVTAHGDTPRTFKLTLQLVNEDKLEGDIEGRGDDGGTMSGKIALTRERPTPAH